MKYAVVKTGGKQYIVEPDDVLEIDKLLNERVVKLPAPDVSGLRFPE